MRRNYFLMILMLLMGFSSKAMAQMHTVSVEYDKAAFSTFWCWGGDNLIGKVGEDLSNIQVADGTNVYFDTVKPAPGYELVEFVVNGVPQTIKNPSYLRVGNIVADTQVKLVTKKSGGDVTVESFPINIALKGVMPQGYFFSVYEQAPGLPMKKLSNGDKVEKGNSIKLSWGPEIGVPNNYDAQVSIDGKPLSADIIAAKNYTMTVNKEINIEYSFVEKAPAIQKHELSVNVHGEGGTFSLLNGVDFVAKNETTFTNSFEEYTILQMNLTPDKGYEVDMVTVDDIVQYVENNSLELTIRNAAVNVVVTFRKKEIVKYDLNINVEGEGGTFDVAHGMNYLASDATSFTDKFIPNDVLLVYVNPKENYEVASVTLNGVEKTLDGALLRVTTIAETSNVVIKFKQKEVVVTKYDLNVNVEGEGGTFDVTYGANYLASSATTFTNQFAANENVDIYINANENYEIASVTLNGAEQTLDGRRLGVRTTESVSNVVITFKQKQVVSKCQLNVSVEGGVGGLIYLSQYEPEYKDLLMGGLNYSGEFAPNAYFSVYAEANNGYEFKDITVNGVSQGTNEFMLTLTEAVTDVVVSFKQLPKYELTVNVEGEGGSFDLLNGGDVLAEKATTYTDNFIQGLRLGLFLNIDEGYEVSTVTINGEEQILEEMYGQMFTAVPTIAGPTAVVVKFKKIGGGEVVDPTKAHLTITVKGEGTAKLDLVNLFQQVQKTYAENISSTNPFDQVIDKTTGTSIMDKTQLQLSLFPAAGYKLESVMVNGYANPCDYGVTGFFFTEDTDVIITFAEDGGSQPVETFTVDWNINGQGTVTATTEAGDVVEKGAALEKYTKVIFTPAAAEGWELGSLMIDGRELQANSEGKLEWIVEQNVVLDVTFVEQAASGYTFSVAVEGQGVFDLRSKVDGMMDDLALDATQYDGKLNAGANLYMYIRADEGWSIESVMNNGVDVTSQLAETGFGSERRLNIENLSENSAYVIKFKDNSAPQQFTFSANVEGGNGKFTVLHQVGMQQMPVQGALNVESFTSQFEAGKALILQLKANEGFVIDQVTLNGEAYEMTNENGIINITLNQDENYVIKFKENAPVTGQLKLTVNVADEHGVFDIVDPTMTPIISDQTAYEGSFDAGTQLGIIIKPAEGWKVGTVIKNGTDEVSTLPTGVGAQRGVLIESLDADESYSISFEKIPVKHQLTVSIEGEKGGMFNIKDSADNGSYTGGDQTASATVNIKEGANVYIEITADPGYVFSSLMKGEEDLTAQVVDNKFMIENFSADASYVIAFKEDKPAVEEYALKINVNDVNAGTFTIVTSTEDLATDATEFDGKVAKGASFSIRIAPNEGFEIESVLLNGEDISARLMPSAGSNKKQIVIQSFLKDETYMINFKKMVGIAENIADNVYYDAVAEILRAPEEVMVELFNITGAKVATAQGDLNMSALNDGIYLAKVTVDGKVAVIKIAK